MAQNERILASKSLVKRKALFHAQGERDRARRRLSVHSSEPGHVIAEEAKAASLS
jgi:hypothetical protein